jgi:hypothetical protein
MQQRQLRLGDILDDYCPRERRVTNHAVVAMVGEDVKQTRCTTCDAEHEYKHAKVPRQRRKSDTPAALYSQVLANGPKRVVHESASTNGGDQSAEPIGEPTATEPIAANADVVATPHESDDAAGAALSPMNMPNMTNGNGSQDQIESAQRDDDAGKPQDGESAEPLDDESIEVSEDEGPVHRPLIRASLPRPEGQPPQSRPLPEFTIRQPGGRQNRFRPRHQRGAQPFPGNRSNGGSMTGPPRGARPSGGRPPQGPPSRLARRNGPGRKRSK